jgi:putative tryptophan/tyrosine transport system substrate-binding protein
VNARTESDLESAFADFSQQRVGAILVGDSTLFARRMEQLVALAAHHALPAIFVYREFALAGDPVALGLVANLNRPGANLTGFSTFAGELAAA